MTDLSSLLRKTQLPLSVARELVKNESNAQLETEYIHKCVSCDYKEQWYQIRICTYDARGVYGEHSQYDCIPVLENPPSKLRYFSIKVKKELLDNHLKNFPINPEEIDKAMSILNYLESVIKNDYLLLPRTTSWEQICNDCFKKPNNSIILKSLHKNFLKPEWIEVIEKQ